MERIQSAQWGGRQAAHHGQASTLRFEAEAGATVGGQTLVADWRCSLPGSRQEMPAMMRQARLVDRFSPDFRAAFEDWVRTDPFENPDAPAGPGFMPGFTNPGLRKAQELNDQASASFAAGTSARETANRYARNTVLLATVLFLVAIA